jgi:hypothetical protein
LPCSAVIFIQFESEEAFSNASRSFSSRGITFHASNRTMEILSAPLRFTSNPVNFDPLVVSLIGADASINASSLTPTCLMRTVIPSDGFYSFESWARQQFFSASSPPSAFIAFGGSFAVGGYQVNHIGIPSLTAGINVPIVHISHESGNALAQLVQQSGGGLNITITDFPENPFFTRKSGPVFLFYSIILCVWCVLIIVLSALSLHRRTIGRNLGTLCLFLDIIGAVVRFCWALDPFADRFIPPPIIDTLFTASWPIVLSGTIVLLLFWHELATIASLNVSSVLDRNTIPAVVTILILFVIEILSDSFRASRVRLFLARGKHLAGKT